MKGNKNQKNDEDDIQINKNMTLNFGENQPDEEEGKSQASEASNWKNDNNGQNTPSVTHKPMDKTHFSAA